MSSDGQRQYSPAAVEERWQAIWDERGTNSFTAEELGSAERPYFCLLYTSDAADE